MTISRHYALPVRARRRLSFNLRGSARPYGQNKSFPSAKSIKVKLEGDPYNQHLLFELGAAYARDGLWKQSTNVLLRGWAGLATDTDPAFRFAFGMKG